MNENIKLFLEKISADEELQAKFSQIKDRDEAYELAAGLQDGFTKEEFVEGMTKLKAAMDESLTDEDLAKSAGGITDGQIELTFDLVVTAASAATAASTSAIIFAASAAM